MISLLLGVSAQAAGNNPFSEKAGASLPDVSYTNRIVNSVGGKGYDYWTPLYKKKVRITVTSTNKKVAVPKASVSKYYDGTYQGWMKVIRKGYGTSKIKVTVKIGNKSYKTSFTYKFYKYENPFSSFKIGGRQYKSKLAKLKKGERNEDGTDYNYYVNWKLPSGKLTYKLKKGFQITSMIAYAESEFYNLKNNKKIPAHCDRLFISYQNKKTGAKGYIAIE